MSNSIYLIQSNGDLVAMSEQPYESEALLQELLAKYPDALAGDQMGGSEPRQWLLVTREMSIPSEDNGAGRWSVDHLFLDQEAVPTIVEVKRSTDTRIRREVVGQMLDYAANGVVYWPVERIRAQFEQGCAARGQNSQEVFEETLGPETDPDRYWADVATNLRAGKIRMIFIADRIPPELQRVVEFLNSQMNPAEVLAVEVRQFVGEGVRTLVPTVLGRTAESDVKKPPRILANEAAWMVALNEHCGRDGFAAMMRLYEFTKREGVEFSWGHGAEPAVGGRFLIGGKVVTVWVCYAYADNPKLEIGFLYMRSKHIPVPLLASFAEQLRKIPGVDQRFTGLEQKDFRKGPTLPINGVVDVENAVAIIETAISNLQRTAALPTSTNPDGDPR